MERLEVEFLVVPGPDGIQVRGIENLLLYRRDRIHSAPLLAVKKLSARHPHPSSFEGPAGLVGRPLAEYRQPPISRRISKGRHQEAPECGWHVRQEARHL